MKKSIMTIAAAIGIMAAAATANAAGVTIEDAKKTALTAAGFTEKDVVFTRAGIDYDDGFQYYEVDFVVGQTKYEFDINPSTGAIMKRDIDVRDYNDMYDFDFDFDFDYDFDDAFDFDFD